MRTKTAYCEKPAAEQPLSDDEITRQLIENAVNPGARYPNEATPPAEPPAGVEANAGVSDEPAGDNEAVQQALQEHGAFDRHDAEKQGAGLPRAVDKSQDRAARGWLTLPVKNLVLNPL